MAISNDRIIESNDRVEFRFNKYRAQGVVDFVSHSRGRTWYYVDWDDGYDSEAWYPCLREEIHLISKGGNTSDD